MTFCLDSVIIKPEDGFEIKNAVILLHGYGGDGKDISMLSLNWKRHLPNTIFICPNAHESCDVNPTGYQWFDLSKNDPNYILNQSIKAENKINFETRLSEAVAEGKITEEQKQLILDKREELRAQFDAQKDQREAHRQELKDSAEAYAIDLESLGEFGLGRGLRDGSGKGMCRMGK